MMAGPLARRGSRRRVAHSFGEVISMTRGTRRQRLVGRLAALGRLIPHRLGVAGDDGRHRPRPPRPATCNRRHRSGRTSGGRRHRRATRPTPWRHPATTTSTSRPTSPTPTRATAASASASRTGSIIDGITVRAGALSTDDCGLSARPSACPANAGANWTGYQTANLTRPRRPSRSAARPTRGAAVWDPTQLTNSNFRVELAQHRRAAAATTPSTTSVDWVTVTRHLPRRTTRAPRTRP